LFTLVEHFIELQEMTHPGSAEKAKRIEHYVAKAFQMIGKDSESLVDIKSRVRQCYAAHLA